MTNEQSEPFQDWVNHTIEVVYASYLCRMQRKRALTSLESGLDACQEVLGAYFDRKNSTFMRLPGGATTNLDLSDGKEQVH